MTLRYDHLVGRSFLWGVRDCFSLVRDFFHDNFGIEITNYARPVGWSAERRGLIRHYYEREGFELVSHWKAKDLRPADVLCCAIGESEPNHFVVNVGDNQLVHHLFGRISSVEPYRDFWRNSTCFVLRHPEVPDLRPVLPTANLADILRARYQPQAA